MADLSLPTFREIITYYRTHLLVLTTFPAVVIDLIIDYSKEIPKFQAKFVASFGQNGSRSEEEFPTGVAILNNKKDGNEYLIVTDEDNHNVVMYDKKGSCIRTIGEGEGEQNGQFDHPFFVLVEKDEIFVADSYNHRIQVLNAYDGKFLRTIGKGEGRAPGELMYPQGMTIIGNRLYISEGSGDHSNNRISVFHHQTGDYLFSFGSTGFSQSQFDDPVGITSDDNGRIYIVDCNNDRIQIFNEEGVYIDQYGGKSGISDQGELDGPISIIIRQAEMFISECNNDRISIWDIKNGNYLRYFGTSGKEIGQFHRPYGMTLTSHYELVICDQYNHRLQIFE